MSSANTPTKIPTAAPITGTVDGESERLKVDSSEELACKFVTALDSTCEK